LNQSDAKCNRNYLAVLNANPDGFFSECEKLSSNSTADVDLICDISITNPVTLTQVNFDESECTFYTKVTGADACEKLSINSLWEFFDQYDYLWGAIFILLGIFFTFFGRKLFLVAVFISALIIVTIVILALSYGTFLADNDK